MTRPNGVEALELSTVVMGATGTIHPTLVWGGDTVILVDAGVPGQLPQLRAAMVQAGVTLAALTHVIITHHDIDHLGGLGSILSEVPGVRVLAHAEEVPYIEGEKRPIKLAQLEAQLGALPAGMKALYEGMRACYASLRVHVDRTLADGEQVACCGGITVIHTPGHTPGHISLYLHESRTLIAGDALAVEGGQLVAGLPHTNVDDALALRSLARLTRYDVQTAICYHGGVYGEDVNRSIAELAGDQAGAC